MTEIQEILHNEKIKEWEERVFQCRDSGLSVKEWCRQNRISESTYFYWQREVWDKKKNELQQTGTPEKGIRRIRFAEVSIERNEDERKGNRIEIEHNGWIIRIENDITPELLIQIIQMAV